MTEVTLPDARLVSAGDIALSVTDVGAGPAIVWLHGSGPGASGLSNFRANLPAFADHRNLVFDHPRYGLSDRPTINGPLIPHSGEHILAALDTLGVDTFAVVGNSFGGGVAAWLAATAPARVRSAVLMAPAGLQPPGIAIEDLPYGLQLIFKAMRDGVDRPLMETFINTMVFDKSLATPELIDARLAAAQRNNPEWEGRPIVGDLSEVVPLIQAPIQLLWGKEDKFVLPAWSTYWLDRLSDVELHVLPHCGHWFQYELKDRFNELAGEFIRRNEQ
ncbi:alpha/beta fold hydrolase [Microbacterium deminutum]|uniref:Alpha/beta fold hydrolase n=2 Tax=Microbacterium deminutum TaxID=344164 RepID=A0ABN2RHA9_9MICO